MNAGQTFARRWAAAWNSGSLEQALELWADDLEFESPLASQITGSPIVRGKPAAAAYWGKALSQASLLKFELLEVYWDPVMHVVTIIYRRERDGDVRVAGEIVRLNALGLGIHGRALHGAAAA